MKTTVASQKVIIETKVTSITCDCCGKTIEGEQASYSSDITNIKAMFGYGSKFDDDTWSIDVCDSCIESWVKTFKHIPQGME